MRAFENRKNGNIGQRIKGVVTPLTFGYTFPV